VSGSAQRKENVFVISAIKNVVLIRSITVTSFVERNYHVANINVMKSAMLAFAQPVGELVNNILVIFKVTVMYEINSLRVLDRKIVF